MSEGSQHRNATQILEDLRTKTLPQVIEDELSYGYAGYDQHIENLREELKHVSSTGKQYLHTAISSLKEAREASKDPIKCEVARAVKMLANEYNLPLHVGSKQTPNTYHGKAGLNNKTAQEWIEEKLAVSGELLPTEITQMAKNESLKINTIQTRLRKMIKEGIVIQEKSKKRNNKIYLAKK